MGKFAQYCCFNIAMRNADFIYYLLFWEHLVGCAKAFVIILSFCIT